MKYKKTLEEQIKDFKTDSEIDWLIPLYDQNITKEMKIEALETLLRSFAEKIREGVAQDFVEKIRVKMSDENQDPEESIPQEEVKEQGEKDNRSSYWYSKENDSKPITTPPQQ